ncbi:MAG: hypothetical protein WBA89_06200 [Microcoleus sp.]|uniref:hypothetical protein n=1 Tax=Microcoleus sp. TaxID=44472 RepID=UPI003C72866C
MADWPDNAQKIGDDCYYKVDSSGTQILLGKTEDDIDRNYSGSKNHVHYYKENGSWYVRTTEGSVRQEIYAKYGGSRREDDTRGGYGNSLYGTTGASVDEGLSSWLDSLLD